MKKFIIILISISMMLFSSCNVKEKKENPADNSTGDINSFAVRATWLTCFEMKSIKNITEQEFIIESEKIFKDIFDLGFNHAFVHVRPFGDAIYPSDYFPWSEYITGKQGQSLPYDPMKIMIESAHKNNVKFHAWINPYRVALHNDLSRLSSDNPALKYSDDIEKVYMGENGIYYNPTSVEMQRLILDGIKEIVKKYEVDGIHIDDYFYPTKDEIIDEIAFKRYIEQGGKNTLEQWRVRNVDNLISGIYNTVKSVNKDVIVSISPSGDIEKNLKDLYADAQEWMCNTGYCDWIVPQIYFGFENEYLPFDKTLSTWLNLCENPKCKIVIGLACYKCCAQDKYAGIGIDEWVRDDTVLKRQLKLLAKNNVYGFAMFSYSFALEFRDYY